MGLIEQIFVHQIVDPYLFILLTLVEILNEKDCILGLHKVQQRRDSPVIIGINSVHAVRLYVVDLNEHTSVWVDWQVEFLRTVHKKVDC